MIVLFRGMVGKTVAHPELAVASLHRRKGG